MRKLFCPIMSIIIIISLLLMSINVSAISTVDINNSEEIVLELLDDCGNTNSIRSRKPLYNSSEEIIAYLYFLNPNGYVVVSLHDLSVKLGCAA